MKYVCELEQVPKGHVACIRTRCASTDIPKVLGEGYEKIVMHLQSIGMHPTGMPYTAYFNMDMNNLDIELGIPVDKAFEGTEEVVSGELAAGPYAVTVYTGPYGELEPAYKALSDWMAEHGHVPVGVAYEFYLNDPGETPPEKLITKIMFPLK